MWIRGDRRADSRHDHRPAVEAAGDELAPLEADLPVVQVAAILVAPGSDTMHVAVSPIELERGERLWTSPDELLDRYYLESIPSPSGVTHLLFWWR